jgi:hypothetical protein
MVVEAKRCLGVPGASGCRAQPPPKGPPRGLQGPGWALALRAKRAPQASLGLLYSWFTRGFWGPFAKGAPGSLLGLLTADSGWPFFMPKTGLKLGQGRPRVCFGRTRKASLGLLGALFGPIWGPKWAFPGPLGGPGRSPLDLIKAKLGPFKALNQA